MNRITGRVESCVPTLLLFRMRWIMIIIMIIQHRLNGYLAQRVPSLFLASSFRMCLDCEGLKGAFPWRASYRLSPCSAGTGCPTSPVPLGERKKGMETWGTARFYRIENRKLADFARFTCPSPSIWSSIYIYIYIYIYTQFDTTIT